MGALPPSMPLVAGPLCLFPGAVEPLPPPTSPSQNPLSLGSWPGKNAVVKSKPVGGEVCCIRAW